MQPLDSAIKNCPLTKFIDSLDITPSTGRVDIENELKSIESDQHNAIKIFYSRLKNYYSSIPSQYEDIKTYCCSYLNFWLNKEKEKKSTSEPYINTNGWQVIENLWEMLNGPFSCKRKRFEKSTEDQKKCIDFMVYCVNREVLKKECVDTKDNYLKQLYCTNFDNFTNKYYEEFKKAIPCLRNTNKDYNWTFSDTCTLHNMAITFPKYNDTIGKIMDVNTRNQIKKCENNEESSIIDCYMLEGVPVTFEEVSPSIDISPWKFGFYGGSSLLGFLCLSVFLYKVKKINSQNIHILKL
ncbi:hypothetical protein PVIIG_05382 [Plasmodium vivax India VII]|uniref:Uncharacterized protein n=1 Tax=Plasmodium vivax India VII TaxID=1077284 RepID=A0A0J9UU88_PLAVI|nr:hypothetical protein PVIIG_05382 [Plasmodium vivax India VII]